MSGPTPGPEDCGKWLVEGHTLYVLKMEPMLRGPDRAVNEWWAQFQPGVMPGDVEARDKALRLAAAAPDLLAACEAIEAHEAAEEAARATYRALRAATPPEFVDERDCIALSKLPRDMPELVAWKAAEDLASERRRAVWTLARAALAKCRSGS